MSWWTSPPFQTIITVLGSVLASSGLWAYVQRKSDRKSATTRLLLGLAHDRIINAGMKYIERGWISKEEYDDLIHYLYGPYSKFGGNGLARKIMSEINKLPIRGTDPVKRSIYVRNENERYYRKPNYDHDGSGNQYYRRDSRLNNSGRDSDDDRDRN